MPTRTRRPSIVLAAAFLVAAPSPAGAGELTDDIDTYLSRLERFGFAGVVLIARDGRPIFAEGYGMADRERGIPWSPGTVSTIGSITKQFTGAAILLLEQEGRLSVTDTLAEHFDDVPEDKQAITLHQLLTHSSGIVDLDGLGDWDPIDRATFIERSMVQPLAFAPGESFAYSNAGYSLLGAIIEQSAGLPYEQFVRDRLFVPNGMFETGYILPRWGEARLAQGYADGGRWGTVLERPMDGDGPYWVLRANGGIHSTAYDMLRWTTALMEGRVLGSAAMERYWAPHVSEGGDSSYGYGWSMLTLPAGAKVVTHNGGNGIHFADLAIVPDAGLVLFIQCNVVADFPLAPELLHLLGMRLVMDEPLPQVPDVAGGDPVLSARLAGAYRVGTGSLRVGADGPRLVVEANGAEAFAALHSTRPVDLERARRLTAEIDRIVTAFTGGDFGPQHDAYGGRTPVERLEAGWRESLAEWEAQLGDFQGHDVLGTAMRPGRDVTLVRFRFAGGDAHRAYVWTEAPQDVLRGYSRRGMDHAVTFHPIAGGGFASWDRMTGATKALRFERAADGASTLVLGESARAVRVTR